MRTCPHCQFLVADGATTCSVCQGDLSAPLEHAAVGGPPFVAPGRAPGAPAQPQHSFTAPAPYGTPGAAVPPPPGAAWPPPPPGAQLPPGVGVPQRRGMSTTKILLIVGLVCLVPVLGLAGLFVLGSVAEKQLGGELVADELPWAAHEDPGGWYVLDMPGNVSVDTIEMPGGFGSASVSVETALVSARDFGATVTRAPAAVPEGQTFVAEAYSVEGAERALSDAGAIDDAEVVAHDVVPGTDDLQMFLEVRGTVEGEPAVLWSRLVIAGADLYELNAVGLLEDRDEIEAILDRMVSSFTPT